jgi:hypothetical protein
LTRSSPSESDKAPTASPDDYGDPLLPNPGATSPQKRKSNIRNDGRLAKARKKDTSIISKYLHGDPASFVSAKVSGPDDHFKPPAWLMQSVWEITNEKVKTPQGPPIRFSMDHEAARYNSSLLEKENFDFDKLLEANGKTTLNYGSEFRPLQQLVKILGLHPNSRAQTDTQQRVGL